MQNCQVCFDSFEYEVPERPCGHRVCRLCEEACASNSSPCPASSLCSGLPLLEENETTEQAFCRVTREISDLEDRFLADTSLLTLNLDIEDEAYQKRLKLVSKKVSEKLCQSYVENVLASVQELINIARSDEYLKEKFGDQEVSLLNTKPELSCLKISNGTITGAEYVIAKRPKLGRLETYHCLWWSQGQLRGRDSYLWRVDHKVKATYFVFWGNLEITCSTNHENSECVVSITNLISAEFNKTEAVWKKELKKNSLTIAKVRQNFNSLLENNCRALKCLEQKLEQLEEKLQSAPIDPQEVVETSNYSIDLNFAKMEARLQKRIAKNWMQLAGVVKQGMPSKQGIAGIPLLVRANFCLPNQSKPPSTGGVALAVLEEGCSMLVTFVGDPFNLEPILKRKSSMVLLGPKFHCLGVFVQGNYVVFPSSTGKYNAVSISAESWGKFSQVDTKPPSRPGVDFPWADQRSFAFFRHEPTRTFCLCGRRKTEFVPFASQRY